MANAPMLVDVLRHRVFAAVGAVAALLLLGALLLGLLGPATYEHNVYYAYQCEDGAHSWNPVKCSGKRLGEPGAVWTHKLGPLETLNGFWSLVMFPYDRNDTKVVETLKVEIDVFGRSSSSADAKRLSSHEVKETMLCDNGRDEPCWGFVLVYEDTIKYPYYEVVVSLPDDDDNEKAKALVGDVAFEFSWYNVSFIEEQLMMRVSFLVVSTAVIFAFWFRMRNVELYKWTIEQRCIGFLLLTLILLNNPLYPVEYLVSGWFFPALDALFQVTHSVAHMIFWLFAFDFIRRDGTIDFQGWRKPTLEWLKPIVAIGFGIFTFAFFLWFRIAQQVDPVFGDSGSASGLVVMFFVAALLFGTITVWILVLMMLTIPVVLAKTDYLARFVFLAVPTALCMFSIIAALFVGSFGPVRRTAPTFCYFYTLYNLYAWILAFGYWPAATGSLAREATQPSEATPIFKTFHEGTRKADSDDDFAGDDDEVYGDDNAL